MPYLCIRFGCDESQKRSDEGSEKFFEKILKRFGGFKNKFYLCNRFPI